ncbi:MAG: stress response translation initiation inhibitor YciH [Candidatus Aenigmatarchaeota archaeon]
MICSKCGLPEELCTCNQLDKLSQKIIVRFESRTFGKKVTIIEGITSNQKEIASKLKSKLGCGGTIKNGRIELQGDHRKKIKQLLVELGFKENQIEIY